MKILIIYIICLCVNVLYISAHNSIIEVHPKDDNDLQPLSYWNIFNPIFTIMNLKNL